MDMPGWIRTGGSLHARAEQWCYTCNNAVGACLTCIFTKTTNRLGATRNNVTVSTWSESNQADYATCMMQPNPLPGLDTTQTRVPSYFSYKYNYAVTLGADTVDNKCADKDDDSVSFWPTSSTTPNTMHQRHFSY